MEALKGLILSGGAGTRLRPITHTSAKQLVPVANKPILFYGIEDMAAAGITDIGIIVGDTRDEIASAVGDGSRWGVNVTYLPQEAPLGHDAVHAIEPSARGELEITDAIQWLLDEGDRVRHEVLAGWWIDTGKKDDLLHSNRLILETIETRIEGSVDAASTIEGRVVVGAGAEIVGSRVRGPVIIGERTRVTNSFIGPFTSISYDCEITDSELDHSVVLEESRIVGIAGIADSLVGKEVEIIRSGTRPRALRLMLGDHSRVDLE